MRSKITEHQLRGIAVESKRKGGWRVLISSDNGRTSVDFSEKRLAVDFAKRHMRLVGKRLSPTDYAEVRCGPSAAARVLEFSKARKGTAAGEA